jgi:ABC-type transport system substrate-binding protein
MRHQDQSSSSLLLDMTMRRRRFLGLAGAAAAAHILGSGPAQSQSAPKRGGILRVSCPGNPSSLDPYTGGSGYDHCFLYTMFDTLIEWDYETLKAMPGLAESWTFTDPQTLVLNLRKDVVFHDGTPFNAEAVKFNLDRGRMDPRSNVKGDLVTVASVEVSGPLQVTIKLKQPDTALPLILSDRSGMMASPKAVVTLAKDFDRKPVGTGPWKFVSFVDGEKVTTTRNEKYWKEGRPYLDGVELAVIPELATGLRSVVAGENNFIYALQPQQKVLVDRAKSLTSANGPTVGCFGVYFNLGRPPFNDLRIRKAFNFAINRDDFVKLTLGGVGEPARMVLPTAHWAYDKETAGLYPHDPDMAKKLLAEAGFKDGIDLNLVGFSDQSSLQRQEVLIEQLKQGGMRLRFTNGTVSETTSQYFGPEKRGDGFLAGWTGRPDPSLTYSLLFMKDAYYNTAHVEPPQELTDAISDSRKFEDIESRRTAFAKVQRLAMENALWTPLAFQFELDAYSGKVRNYKPNLLGKPKFEHIYLDG